MYKRMTSLVLALVMCLSLCVTGAGAAADDADFSLETLTDKEFEDARVSVCMILNGNDRRYVYFEGNEGLSTVWSKDLGYPVLLNLKTGDRTLTTTWLPIRLCCDAMGIGIEWVEKTAEEEAHAVIHSADGDIKLHVGDTAINLPDGSQYQVTEYTLSDGSPVPVVLSRQGRIYVLVRGLTEALLHDTNFVWRNNGSFLEIYGNFTEGGMPKTYGINENYATDYGFINVAALPNLNRALEGKEYKVDDRLFYLTTTNPLVSSFENHLYVDATTSELMVQGFCSTKDDVQIEVFDAMLKDLINDADRETIIELLKEVQEKLSVGYDKRRGITQEAQVWLDKFPKSYTLDEVVLEWTDTVYLREFTIKPKE